MPVSQRPQEDAGPSLMGYLSSFFQRKKDLGPSAESQQCTVLTAETNDELRLFHRVGKRERVDILQEGSTVTHRHVQTSETLHKECKLNYCCVNASREGFLKAYPEFATTASLDALRATDFSRVDEAHHTYLDYTGGALYPACLVKEHAEMMLAGTFGNPHSTNPTSLAMTKLVEDTRAAVLAYFNADPREYECIFTSNASGAMRIVGESYPFVKGGHYLALADNHNSVNGIREFARARGATVTYSPVTSPTLRINEDELHKNLETLRGTAPRLFAFPAQSNFSGVQHPLHWVAHAQGLGWDVLLDVAAFVPTNRLDLSVVKPEFAAMSFYKMFGYPTGVGALIAKRSALTRLRRPWFAGGTIEIVSVARDDLHIMHSSKAEVFEDGTVNYLTIPAVHLGLKFMQKVGIDTIKTRVRCLTLYLVEQLESMVHTTGRKAVVILGPGCEPMRGCTVAMLLFDSNGQVIDTEYVEHRANELMISLRTGCFCNPGNGEAIFNVTPEKIDEVLEQALITPPARSWNLKSEYMKSMAETAGAIRVSVGMATTFEDVFRYVAFVAALCELPGSLKLCDLGKWLTATTTKGTKKRRT